MKNILKIVVLSITALNCGAQSPIININNRPDDDVNGAYYKDVDNLFNLFEGTYIGNIRGHKLEITFQKKEMSFNSKYYEDMLVGEYKYSRNNVVITDRLNDININYTNQANHSIDGTGIIQYGDYLCHGCSPTEVRFDGGLVDRNSKHTADILISRIISNGQPAIKLWIGWRTTSYNVETELPTPASFPGGDYIMIKQ